nr:DnaA/Hda family protein [Pseudomarimonas arenosa]
MQLPLNLARPESPGLEQFMPLGSPLVAALRGWLAELRTASFSLLLSAPAGCGKTHLLLALGAAAANTELNLAYLPLAQLGQHAESVLAAQPVCDGLLIDDLQVAEHSPALQLALFALHNRQRDAGGGLLYAGRGDPHDWHRALPDLVSRLGQCTRFNIPPLSEEQRRHWLAKRAAALGLVLDEAALDYVFRRVGRDMHGLCKLLDQLNHASLVQQRRITLPFLRQVIQAPDAAD